MGMRMRGARTHLRLTGGAVRAQQHTHANASGDSSSSAPRSPRTSPRAAAGEGAAWLERIAQQVGDESGTAASKLQVWTRAAVELLAQDEGQGQRARGDDVCRVLQQWQQRKRLVEDELAGLEAEQHSHTARSHALHDKAEALERELLADPKEIAEHLMLIDLGRNDVGRVAEIGSVTLTEQMVVERYSHVMHISSNVQGRLRAEFSALDVLRATLPVGTLSGAPKIRAMEIIDELEPTRRGVYGGALGYIAWNGNMDTAIAIRTAVLKDDTLFIQAGGGIVADSIPENEWQESLNKGRAMFRAAALAAKGLHLGDGEASA